MYPHQTVLDVVTSFHGHVYGLIEAPSSLNQSHMNGLVEVPSSLNQSSKNDNVPKLSVANVIKNVSIYDKNSL